MRGQAAGGRRRIAAALLPGLLWLGLASGCGGDGGPEPSAQPLADERGCFACHNTGADARATGPGFRAIAERYAATPGAAEQLAARVRSGTTGNWGPFTMPAQAVSAPEAEQLVRWILSLR